MKTRLSQKQIGKRLMKLRKMKGMSQEDLAKFLKIPRSSIAQIELGNRNISIIELIKLSEVLGFSLDKFLSDDFKVKEEIEVIKEAVPKKQEIRISIPKLKVEKLINLLLYILERCAGKPNVGETVLYKLLYFSDFNYYELYEEHLTGARYKKLPYGPVPQRLDSVITQMIEKGQLQRIKMDYHGYPQTRYIPMEKADLTKLKASEKEVIDRVIVQFSDWSASAISEYSHKDMPWKATEEGDEIDYELVFYRDAPYSVRTYDDEPEQP
jgi:transcriptional regulator with XRE-family HTH domain